MKKRPRASARTLSRLRRDAPTRDRDHPALAPAPPVPGREHPAARFAQTLDELRERLGQHGEFAVGEARNAAVSLWLMDHPDTPHAIHTTYEALSFCRAVALRDSGLSHPEGREWPMPSAILTNGRSESATRIVAAAAVRAWKAAGQPRLTPERIGRTHQFILACIRAQSQEQAA